MKKFLRWFGRSVLALTILVAAFYGVENWRGKHAWEKYRQEREAKGDSFEWSSIVPPPVPDNENFAAIPLFAELFPKLPEHPRLQAIELPVCLDAYGDWHVGRIENLAAWQTCFSNDNLRAALSKYDPILNEITEASQRPKCRFPIRYEVNFDPLFFCYLRDLARAYRLRALAELADRQSDAVLADVQICLRLAKALESEPLTITFLLRMAILDSAIQPVWEGLTAHRWTNAQLVALQDEFARVDQFEAFTKVMRGERLFAYSILRSSINKPGERLWWISFKEKNLSTTPLIKLFNWAVPTGWVYQNMLTADRFYTESSLYAVDWKYRRISPHGIKNVEMDQSRMTPYNILCKLLISPYTPIVKIAAASQTAIDQVATACAIERYRLAKGELPETLPALVSEFIAKVPHDIIDGQPLRYHRTTADRFLLYSVGWNETDDGGQIALTLGKPPRPDFDKGDWVWSSSTQK